MEDRSEDREALNEDTEDHSGETEARSEAGKAWKRTLS